MRSRRPRSELGHPGPSPGYCLSGEDPGSPRDARRPGMQFGEAMVEAKSGYCASQMVARSWLTKCDGEMVKPRTLLAMPTVRFSHMNGTW